MVANHTGLFVDVKRAWLRTQSTGTFNGLPVPGVSLPLWQEPGGRPDRMTPDGI